MFVSDAARHNAIVIGIIIFLIFWWSLADDKLKQCVGSPAAATSDADASELAI